MNRIIFGLVILGLLILSSCGGKKVIYVKDMLADTTYLMNNIPPLRVQKGDRLHITIQSKTPELAAPFNSDIGSYRINEDGNVSTSSIGQTPTTDGYLVDDKGQISFPILGSLDVNNLTLDEVKKMIHQRLVSDKLINDPLVKVNLINLKITVTGAVVSQQIIKIPEGRLTLLEALTQAGGLTSNASPDKITIIREENGMRKKIMANIESQDIFNSPAYYLQQNDLVYVEPKNRDTTPREERNWRMFSTFLGAAALVISIFTLSR